MIDEFEEWKNIVGNANNLTFNDFMFRLNKAIERNKKEMERIKKQGNK